jgi:6-pyruvoyltetrahydropterin/6-carboxytetrahydropterin synthase
MDITDSMRAPIVLSRPAMQVELVKEYRFEAAHRLPNVPKEHKCQRLHGHSFRFEIHVVGPVDADSGWFIDYGVLDDVVNPLVARLDHYYLNEIEGLENPTSEVLSKWLFDRIKARIPQLWAVTIHETCDARCVYRGE